MTGIARLVAFVAIVLPLVSTMQASAQQCSCENLRSEDSARVLLDNSDAVVIARVESSVSTDGDDVLRSQVAIELIYKGEIASRVAVRSSLTEGACGFPSIADTGAYLIALDKGDAGYTTGACRAVAVNYYEPSQTVSSDEYGSLVAGLARLAPPHPPIVPTPLPNEGDDTPDRGGGGVPRAVVTTVLVGLVMLVGGFALGRITSSRG
jgi:hypothetical protein